MKTEMYSNSKAVLLILAHSDVGVETGVAGNHHGSLPYRHELRFSPSEVIFLESEKFEHDRSASTG